MELFIDTAGDGSGEGSGVRSRDRLTLLGGAMDSPFPPSLGGGMALPLGGGIATWMEPASLVPPSSIALEKVGVGGSSFASTMGSTGGAAGAVQGSSRDCSYRAMTCSDRCQMGV